ncbi:hypothetical protein DL765_001850 [Monosporascus sp. GIB2]|nr:hypothetical protein DL765_001850 [Monosporascus sp. GIB2]
MQVSAPELHKKTLSLIQLWRLKMDKANGPPFEAGRNISDYAFGAILSASFGQSHEATQVSTQIEHLNRAAVDVSDSMDEPVQFTRAPFPLDYEAIRQVVDSIGITIRATFPRQKTWFMQRFTKLGKYYKTKDEFLRKGPAVFYQGARDENRYPTANEVVRIRAPCLDAFLEETFRYMPTSPLLLRETVVDTQILGHWVPKGTTIWPTSSVSTPWPEDDIGKFKPERWLRPKAGVDKAKLATDVQDHNYSDFDFDKKAGLRGCFGQRLAHLELRISLVLVLWEFELLPFPESPNTFNPVHGTSTHPRDCYVRLKLLV